MKVLKKENFSFFLWDSCRTFEWQRSFFSHCHVRVSITSHLPSIDIYPWDTRTIQDVCPSWRKRKLNIFWRLALLTKELFEIEFSLVKILFQIIESACAYWKSVPSLALFGCCSLPPVPEELKIGGCCFSACCAVSGADVTRGTSERCPWKMFQNTKDIYSKCRESLFLYFHPSVSRVLLFYNSSGPNGSGFKYQFAF